MATLHLISVVYPWTALGGITSLFIDFLLLNLILVLNHSHFLFTFYRALVGIQIVGSNLLVLEDVKCCQTWSTPINLG